jgi:hypothetical protein
MMHVAVRFQRPEPAADSRIAAPIGATAPSILEVIFLGIKPRAATAFLDILLLNFVTLNPSEGGLPF